MDDRRVGGWWVGWMNKCIHGRVVGWMIDAYVNAWMDGWIIEGLVGRLIDG